MAKTASYGIDAPGTVFRLGIAGLAGMGAAIGIPLAFGIPFWGLKSSLCWMFVGWLLWAGGCSFVTSVFMVLSSTWLKFGVRDKVVARLHLTGHEQVLDVGCGRGLALIAAAKRLNGGKAYGVDIWSAEDLSGNSPARLLANAEAEGVAYRVQVDTGDARHLPYADGTFDAVVSMTAIHNIKSRDGRDQALAEMVRVLKPGGRLSLFDIFHPFSYVSTLKRLGMNVEASGLTFLWLVPGRRIWGTKNS